VKSPYWLEAQNITSKKNGFEVVKDLNIKFKNNEQIIILGPNGSGKSSIVDLINRNIYPIENKSSILKILDQRRINIWELRKYISTVNNDIKSRVDNKLKVFEIILSGLKGCFCRINNPKREELKLVTELVYKMSLEKIFNKEFAYISDGEKQITIIARAIINKPKVLILDEPSTNLDLKSKYFLIDKLKALSKMGINILCITHDVSLITKDYNRVILIKDRKIISDGKPEEVMNNKNIRSLFDVEVSLKENNDSWDISRN